MLTYEEIKKKRQEYLSELDMNSLDEIDLNRINIISDIFKQYEDYLAKQDKKILRLPKTILNKR